MNEQFVKRIKSFAWRLGMALVVVVIDFTATNIGMFDLSPAVVGVLSLVLGEISKQLNTKAV